jgi:hypothetical protein
MAEATNSGPEPPAAFPSAVLDTPDAQAFLSDAAEDLIEEVGGPARGFRWAITRVGPGGVRNWTAASLKGRQVDGLQGSFADGPARAAVVSREFIHIPDAAADRRWPGYCAAIAGEGLGSVLSVPMIDEWETSAALTLYAPAPHAFTSDDVIRAVACARRMSKVCHLLLELARKARTAVSPPPSPLTELAVESLIREYGLTEESALQYLRAVARDLAFMSPTAPDAGTTSAA